MIFVQLSLSYSHYLLILSLPFFSLYCFWPMRRKNNKVVPKVVPKELFKYHYSYICIHDFNTQSTIFQTLFFFTNNYICVYMILTLIHHIQTKKHSTSISFLSLPLSYLSFYSLYFFYFRSIFSLLAIIFVYTWF